MSSPFDTNRYLAEIVRHVDADTSHVEIRLGLDVRVLATLRWAGLDAPERGTETGRLATAVVNGWLPPGSVCEIQTIRDSREKFGRYLATFFDADGVNLNERLIAEGYAVPYDGGHR